MPIVTLRLSDLELADLDRVRGALGRSTWLKALARDAVRARDAFGKACGLSVVAVAPGAPAPAEVRGDPEDGQLVPHATDRQIVAVTGHVQPCRCEKCRPMRRRLRGWA